MARPSPKYKKPKITEKKIKISFFLSQVSLVDQFNLFGTVYAQSCSGDGGSGGTDCYGCDCMGGHNDCVGCNSSDSGCGDP